MATNQFPQTSQFEASFHGPELRWRIALNVLRLCVDFIWLTLYIYIYIYIHTHTLQVYIHMCVYTYIYIYIYTHTYTHIFRLTQRSVVRAYSTTFTTFTEPQIERVQLASNNINNAYTIVTNRPYGCYMPVNAQQW